MSRSAENLTNDLLLLIKGCFGNVPKEFTDELARVVKVHIHPEMKSEWNGKRNVVFDTFPIRQEITFARIQEFYDSCVETEKGLNSSF